MKNATVIVVAGVISISAGYTQVTLQEFAAASNLEATSEESANVSIGDLDGDGDLDLVLAKGRHSPLVNQVLINDGRAGFAARLGYDG